MAKIQLLLIIIMIFFLGCTDQKIKGNASNETIPPPLLLNETSKIINEAENETIEVAIVPENNKTAEANASATGYVGQNATNESTTMPEKNESLNATNETDEADALIPNMPLSDVNETEENETTGQPSEMTDETVEESEPANLTQGQKANQKNITLKERITSFIYQLQHADFDELLSQNASLVVVEPNELNASQIKQLQVSGVIVLSYLSIGEAEKWRDYWQEEWDANPPFWVGENQSSEQSPVVKYWEQEWQELTFSRMDEIASSGYDGFVLDTVDEYHYWEEKGYNKTYTRNEMAEFVKKISATAKNSGKLVFVNNGGSLLDKEGYLDAIDGITSEEAFYYNDAPATWSAWDVALLDKVIAAGKPVLAIDYSTKKELQCDFIKKAMEHGFVPFVTTKELDRIIKVDC